MTVKIRYFYVSPDLQEDTLERIRDALAAAAYDLVVADKDFTTCPACGTEYKLLPAEMLDVERHNIDWDKCVNLLDILKDFPNAPRGKE